MANRGRIVPAVSLTRDERIQLESFVRSRSPLTGLNARLRIIPPLQPMVCAIRRSAKSFHCRGPRLVSDGSDNVRRA
jgi:hypothetical protein